MSVRVCILVLAVSGLLSASIIDTFEDGTTMGWFVPGASPVPPVNIPTGGPAGVDDAYLQIQAIAGLAGPAGAGSRLAVLNESQWTGNYLAAGFGLITMDVNNFGPDDLYLRLLFEDFDAPGPPANLALTADAVFVPAGSGWIAVGFSIGPSDLLALQGTVVDALTEVDVLRIFHNPDPTFPGPGIGIPTVTATLGVDNISAVPEPGTMALLAAGLLATLLVRRRRSTP